MSAVEEVSDETLSVPFQDGVQPPESRMKASSKAFCPVASITAPRSGVEVSLTNTYGAEAYQLLDSAVAALLVVARAMVAPVAMPTAATAPSAVNCFLLNGFSVHVIRALPAGVPPVGRVRVKRTGRRPVLASSWFGWVGEASRCRARSCGARHVDAFSQWTRPIAPSRVSARIGLALKLA